MTDTEPMPPVVGRYDILPDEVRFVPSFPFEHGLLYRARFDPRPLGCRLGGEPIEHRFSLLAPVVAAPPEVERIHPSGFELPENLLRFYVRFTQPMQRGKANEQIAILDSDDRPVPDILYRAPVELWDRSMRCLTVLLDPGRLKRGLGPHRDLGPPLEAGANYTLAIGPGMLDCRGTHLPSPVFKSFHVTAAHRHAVALSDWDVLGPKAGTHDPLVIAFPTPLDWALLKRAITIESPDAGRISGEMKIGRDERSWSFEPSSPWASGEHRIRVRTDLEDVCGNDLNAPFDRPLRRAGESSAGFEDRMLSFTPAFHRSFAL